LNSINTELVNPESSGQHWLILSHCFNMDGRAASITITDKLPYLFEKGIKVSVVSGILGSRDQRFQHLKLLPWGPSGLRFDLRHLVARRWGRGAIYRIMGLLTFILFIPFIIIEQLLIGLSGTSSWALPATFRSLLLIWKKRPDVIYSTGGAYSAHLAGYWLKKITGIKWIAEIHDPMVITGSADNRNTRFMAKLEGLICHDADLVWWFTEDALNSARRRHPELGSRGISILPGVEPFRTDAKYQRSSQMIIGHFGSLSETRSLLPVVEAIDTLLGLHPEIRSDIRVHIYGGSVDSLAAKEIVRRNLGDVFVSLGRLEKSPLTGKSGREQVVDLMHQVDCLLLLHGNIEDCREYIPSKLYEYLWAGRPIIALTYRNPQLDRMLAERKSYVAASDRQEDIVAIIKKAYGDWKEDQLPQPRLHGIGVGQAVDSILNALEMSA
jgi:hypothetical protein